MRKKLHYSFTATLWEWPAKTASWFFLSLPPEYFDQIKFSAPQSGGFGSVRVEAKIGKTVWKTSLFPSKKDKTYILPIKQNVRQLESFGVDDTVDVSVKLI